MTPPGDLLPDPLRITGDPALTTWFGPGFAIGGGCSDWLLARPRGAGDDGGARTKGVLDGLNGCSRPTVLLRPG
jgi:hypothetical protein